MDFPYLNKCPNYNLFIGGFIALRRPKALVNSRITHIVSVLDWSFENETSLVKGFQHLHVPVDDVDDENLLQWFPRTNVFIQQGLDYWRTNPEATRTADARPDDESGDPNAGSGVLIHCAMGKSRSATVLLAYLLWATRQQPKASAETPDMVSIPPEPLSVVSALMLLRQGRPIAEPNEGFMDQLHLYVSMGCPTTQSELENHKMYRRWMNKRNVAESLRINQAPDLVDIRFEDDDVEDFSTTTQDKLGNPSLNETNDQEPSIDSPSVTGPASTGPTLKCRRCRTTLSTPPHLYAHTPSRSDPSSQPCAHIFLHPLSWMKSTLVQGKLEGRLTCPGRNCGVNVGKFAWQGLRCSCGGWVTPGFGVMRSKVDEVEASTSKVEDVVSGAGMGAPGGGAIRLPPGMKGRGNL